MSARNWKWIGAILVVVLLAGLGIRHWNHRREAEAKAELAAEIRAVMASRVRPASRVVTAEDEETDGMYQEALTLLPTGGLSDQFDADMKQIPWSVVPRSISESLGQNAQALALVDAATLRESGRFAELQVPSLSRWLILFRLLEARGQTALTEGSPGTAVNDVRRMLRIGASLVSERGGSTGTIEWPWAELVLCIAEGRAAGLLSSVATAPGLTREMAPVLIAAAEDGWGTAEAYRRSIEAQSYYTDELHLPILMPDALEYLRIQRGLAESLKRQLQLEPSPPRQGKFGKALDQVREEIGANLIVPTAAQMRMLRRTCLDVRDAIKRRDMRLIGPGSPLDLNAGAESPPGPFWLRRSVEDEARVAVARTAAAIRAFQLREGRPPRTLEQLVPSTVREIPLDPFDGNSLQFEANGDSWRVASRNWRDFGTVPAGSDEKLDTFEVVYPRVAK